MSWFLDSDEQFGIYRRFGIVHARLLIWAQDELRELEQDLMNMDDYDNLKEDGDDYLMSRENDVGRDDLPPGKESRVELLGRLKQKTLEYGEFCFDQTINLHMKRD